MSSGGHCRGPAWLACAIAFVLADPAVACNQVSGSSSPDSIDTAPYSSLASVQLQTALPPLTRAAEDKLPPSLRRITRGELSLSEIYFLQAAPDECVDLSAIVAGVGLTVR